MNRIIIIIIFIIRSSLLALPKHASALSDSGGLDRWDVSHPLDEGLWSDHEDESRSSVEEEENIHVDKRLKGLRNDLRLAEIDSLRLFSKTPLPAETMKPMEYSIFKQGLSALRVIHKHDKHLVMPDRLFGVNKSRCGPAHYRVCAALLLLRGYSDVAHEVLLGVTLDNLKDAEYAATHRGKTNWAKDHPLTDAADILHAALHRIVEGNNLGEGNHSGYENARYWLAGGPKLLDAPATHPVREMLAALAREHAQKCVEAGVIATNSGAEHSVLSGGGKRRIVCVPEGHWDDFTFLELCKRWAEGSLDKDFEDEVATLQRAEIILLLRHELKGCLGRHSAKIVP